MRKIFTTFTLFASISNFTIQAQGISSDYFKARERFKIAAQALNDSFETVESQSFEVKENLTVDAVYLKNRDLNKRLVVVISGTHGVEGPAGSAIQERMLRQMRDDGKGKGSDFLFVHALNPWGFANLRRNTENNVNLNRNYWLKKADVENTAYAKMSGWLEPRGVVQSTLTQLFSTMTQVALGLISGMTKDEFNEGIAGGQDEFPRGLEFIGNKPEPQIEWLAQLLREKGHRYQEIQLYDIHTGLGNNGEMYLITGSTYDENASKILTKMLPSHGPYHLTTGDSEGFYHTIGDSADFLPLVLPTSIKFLAMTVEFGTVGNRIVDKVKTLNRMILENQGHHYGYKDIQTEDQVKNLFLETFLPKQTKWESDVLSKGAWLADLILKQEGP